jgi:hypothetical protein
MPASVGGRQCTGRLRGDGLGDAYHRRVVSFPSVRPGEPITLSASTWTTYERCPAQAEGRLRGVYGPESRASFGGGLAHRIFARHLTQGPIEPEAFEAACREEIGTSMNVKLGALGLKPSQLREVVGEVRELYDRFKTLGTEGFRGAEVSLEVSPTDDLTLRGAIDAVFDDQGGVRLVDWKTKGLGDPGPQLAFYALLWALVEGDVPARLEAVSVGTGERTEAMPSADDVAATADAIARAVAALREAWERGLEMERRAGPWCRWCPLLEECPEGASALTILGDA